jgi:hypothetical protein
MTSHVLITAKTVIKRTWADVEPKLYATLVSGSAVAALLTLLTLMHIQVSVGVQDFLPLAAGLAAGYIKASTHKGDLMAKIAADGPADVLRLAPALAAAAPAVAPEVDGIATILAQLDPAAARTSLSPVTTSVAVPDQAPATVTQ